MYDGCRAARVVVALSAVAASSAPAHASPIEQAARLEDRILEAQLLLDAHRAEQALGPLAEALRLEPASKQALFLMAVAHLQLGRVGEGLPYAQRLARQAGKDAGPHLLLAAFQERLEPEQALAEYAAALRLDPRNAQALGRLQNLSRELPLSPTSLQVFETIAREHPKEPKALLALGVYYRRMGDPLKGARALAESLRLEETVEAHHETAVTYAELRVFEPALRHFERALQLDSRYLPSLYGKAMLLSRHERPREALALYGEILRHDPANALVHFRIGEIHESLADREGAEADYREALRCDPHLQPARYRLGVLLLQQGRLEEAEQELSAASQQDPAHAETHLALARTLEMLARPEEAEAHYQRALELDPTLANAYLSYGNFLMRRGHPSTARSLLHRFEALKAYEDKTRTLIGAIDLRPTDGAAKLELVEHLLSGQRLGLALKMAYRFVLAEPGEALHYRLVARIYTAMKRLDDAIAVLEDGVERLQDSVWLHRALAEVYLEAGHPQRAERERAIADRLAHKNR